MAERIVCIEIMIRIDTNKQTMEKSVQPAEGGDETIEEFLQRVCEVYRSMMERIS